MPDALLTDLLPAGLEIENFNLGDAEQWADVVVDGISINDRTDAAEVRHEEFRDDRYVAALKLDAGNTARVFYLVRAVTPGHLYRAAAAGGGHVPAGPARCRQVGAGEHHGGAAVMRPLLPSLFPSPSGVKACSSRAMGSRTPERPARCAGPGRGARWRAAPDEGGSFAYS